LDETFSVGGSAVWNNLPTCEQTSEEMSA